MVEGSEKEVDDWSRALLLAGDVPCVDSLPLNRGQDRSSLHLDV